MTLRYTRPKRLDSEALNSVEDLVTGKYFQYTPNSKIITDLLEHIAYLEQEKKNEKNRN